MNYDARRNVLIMHLVVLLTSTDTFHSIRHLTFLPDAEMCVLVCETCVCVRAVCEFVCACVYASVWAHMCVCVCVCVLIITYWCQIGNSMNAVYFLRRQNVYCHVLLFAFRKNISSLFAKVRLLYCQMSPYSSAVHVWPRIGICS